MSHLRVRALVGAACLLSVFAADRARADIASSFDAGNDGWAVVAYPFRGNGTGNWATAPLPFDGAMGVPAGSVRVGDVFSETGITAPAAFLGDKGAFYGNMLTYDIFLRYSDNVIYPAVVLVGAAKSLYFDAPSPVVGGWEARVVPLTEAGWKIGGTGLAATQADFLGVLQTLVGLHLYTEWHTGADDTSVDNVVLHGQATPVTSVPETALSVGNYPNPFNPRTTIRFDLKDTGPVSLAVYDAAGRLVRELVATDLQAGRHAVPWDGRDAAGRPVSSGSYLARLEQGSRAAAVRMTLIR